MLAVHGVQRKTHGPTIETTMPSTCLMIHALLLNLP